MPNDKSPLVLVVEDSKSVVDSLQKKIETELGFEVITAMTMAETALIMDERGKDIFVAVLDLALPDAPNGEVVALAQERGVPCVVFTSSLSPATRDRVFSSHVIDYVIKNHQALDEVAYTLGRLHANRGHKVLLVDDSRSARMYIRSLLELYMLQVFEAESGEQALDILAQEKGISLVVTDYEMDGMDGVELTSIIRSQFSREDMAIIGISSRSEKTLSVQFIKQGADDFLDKPFEREEFFCRVAHNIESMERQHRLHELDELKNRFLGMAVHDLRNPISAIKGFTELLQTDVDGCMSDDQAELLDFVHKSALEMNDLVNDLLDISVIESGRLKLEVLEASLAEIVAERVRIMRIPAQLKGITFDVQAAMEGGAIMDRKRMVQVVDNLLSNAVKFSSGGTVITISLTRRGDTLELCVADQGQGIPAKEQELIFNSFQKTSIRPTGGEGSTGLGLSIVQKIVEAHGGRVWVESEAGKGASFYVSLPNAT